MHHCRKVLWLFFTVTALMTSFISLPSIAQQQATKEPAKSPPPKPVRVEQVRLQALQRSFATQGTLIPATQVDVRPQIQGVIAEVDVKDGDRVQRGQRLFRLDDRSQRAALERAQAQVARNEALLKDLNDQLTRQQQLVQEGFVSAASLSTLQSQQTAQQASLAAERANLTAIRNDLSFTDIRAPLSGRAGIVNIYPGSLVQTSTVLVNITQTTPLLVSFSLPQIFLAHLRIDHRPDRATAIELDQGIKGYLIARDNRIDTLTGSIALRAMLQSPPPDWIPGQTVKLRLTVATAGEETVVPLTAITTNPQRSWVYVVGQDNLVQLRPVQIRFQAEQLAAVSGVKAGEYVVTDGKQSVKPGQRVKPTPATEGRS